jgi:hypothetical protein
MLRDLTRRLTLSLAALCALTFALAPAGASRQQEAGKKPDDGRLYPVKSKWKSGYIDRTGKLVIEAKYDHAGEFSEGLAVVGHGFIYEGLDKVKPAFGNFVPIPLEPDGFKWEIIDESGNIVAKLQTNWNYMHSIFSEGLAPFQGDVAGDKSQLFGYMDKTGKTIIEPRFIFAWYFKDGLAPVCVESQRCGIIDRTGEFVVRPVYNETRQLSEGLALVRNEEWLAGYVNKSGEVVLATQFWSPRDADFNEGLAPAAYGTKFGFIDKLGHFSIQPQFDWAGAFSEGLAPVAYGGKMGYVDREGKFAIPASFADAGPFSEGLAAVTTCPGALGAMATDVGGNNCGYGYIDRTGKSVIEERFDKGEPFRGGLAQVYMREDGFGYIDREGNFVWKPGR